MSDRQRNGLILLIVVGLIAASAVVIGAKKTVLGLDLKGGIELVYQATGTPQNPKVTSTNLSEAVQAMDKRVNQLGVAQPSIQTEGSDLIDVQLPNVSNVVQAEHEVGDTTRLAFYDWEANVLVPPTGKGKPQFAASGLTTQNVSAETISQGSGTAAPGASSPAAGGLGLYAAVKLASQQPAFISRAGNARKGSEYFLFGAPGSSACRAYAAASGTPLLKGVHCLIGGGPVQALGSQTPQQAADQGLTPAETAGTQLIQVKQGWAILQGAPASFAHPYKSAYSPQASYYVVRDDAALFGNEITNPQESTGQSGSPVVSFGFTGNGANAFQNVTAEIAKRGSLASIGSTKLNEHFATVLGTQILSVPSIDWQQYPDGIDGSQGAEISGGFTVSSADQLASYLRLGSLPVNLKEISNTTVSATLGSQALHQGIIAGIIGLAVVVIFLLAFYRLLGLIAVGGLVAYGVYFFALIKLIPITLTLAGIAGLVLTIGVAADANIVIFERVKEEIRAGRSIRNGIIEGYKKGLSAIIDANVVTIMTAFILFVLATQDVKGFAFTLGIGTFASLFTAVMATQAILTTLGNSRSLSRPSALGVRRHRAWTFDFMGASRYFFTLSGVILLVGAFAIGGRGLNLGIDFTSGTQVSVGLVHPADVSQIKAVMASIGEADATIQAVHGDKALGRYGFQIQSKYLSPSKYGRLRSELQSRFGIASNNVGNQDINPTSVGPTFGAAVEHSAVIAIIASLLVISVYVALRFDWKYAVPVLIALAHDLLISIGVYALLGRVVTTDTVAALLTILGYSMYDTIIVFDRVRENTKRMPNAAFSQIVNRSMSEVLTRSLATTACTLLPVTALLIFGGSTLQDFAFALLVGVASGAYSSIFIASPVLTHWKEREHGFRLRRERIIAEHGFVPAYASGAGADIDPDRGRRRAAGRLTEPAPEGVSAAEFEALKRDLGLEEATGPGAPARAGRPPTRGRGASSATGGAVTRRAAPPTRPSTPAPPAAPPSPPEAGDRGGSFEHAPDASSDDAVLPNEPRPRSGGGARASRNRKHGRR
ncbi:protein translocase subunit SecD [Conexibacter sp. DBS9H8]|uniref:protein translocase subunit SecD n=1 Tax=Conexibacter sp. DBS9H8 TaxID=2937801 RepID=UPI00200DA250|nr:protein translocase subunit SecD [Conexibacter sp. DBS9H8]